MPTSYDHRSSLPRGRRRPGVLGPAHAGRPARADGAPLPRPRLPGARQREPPRRLRGARDGQPGLRGARRGRTGRWLVRCTGHWTKDRSAEHGNVTTAGHGRKAQVNGPISDLTAVSANGVGGALRLPDARLAERAGVRHAAGRLRTDAALRTRARREPRRPASPTTSTASSAPSRFDPPRIWAGGPTSGRKGGEAGFASLHPLSPLDELAWRMRIEGSLGHARAGVQRAGRRAPGALPRGPGRARRRLHRGGRHGAAAPAARRRGLLRAPVGALLRGHVRRARVRGQPRRRRLGATSTTRATCSRGATATPRCRSRERPRTPSSSARAPAAPPRPRC